ncbi:MAG: hypothetical protein U1E29_09720 [Coriobacteriia bacterium]|nr:hypothetical protein [Coriobacteriia bacterium]
MTLHITRKLLLLSGVIVAFSLLVAAPAMAETGSYYIDWSEVATLPGNGTSPHGGYNTATVKCGVCHSVHNASALGAEVLLPSSVADACSYCHLDSASGYTQVYNGDPDNYYGTDYSNAHNFYDTGSGWTGVQCTTCHQVHGAANQVTGNAYLAQRLLKNQVQYDLNAGAPLPGDSPEEALTKWCAGCHWTVSPTGDPYYADDYDMGTHIMGTAGANYGNPNAGYSGRIAWKDSTYCTSCHASDFGTPGGWPHMTAGDRFLVTAANSTDTTMPASNASADGVCVRCHRDGTGEGVGLGY